MSRRRHNDTAGTALMLVAAAIAIVIVVAIPIAWFWFEIRRFQVSKPPFTPTPKELDRAERAQNRIRVADEDLKAVRDTAEALGLRFRQDGMYDERNPAAKDVNERRREAESIRSSAAVDYEDARAAYTLRFNQWANTEHYAWLLRGFLAGTAVWYAKFSPPNEEVLMRAGESVLKCGLPVGIALVCAAFLWTRHHRPAHWHTFKKSSIALKKNLGKGAGLRTWSEKSTEEN